MIRAYVMFVLIGICLILMIFSFLNDSMSKRRKGTLFCMALTAILLLVADRLAYVYNGSASLLEGYVARVSKFLVYCLSLLIIYLFNQYLQDLFTHEGKLRDVPKRLILVEYILYAGAAMLLISQATGLYYTFDLSNTYHRSKGFVISYVFPISGLITQITVIISERKKLKRKLFFLLFLFAAMPLITSGIQFFIHGASFTAISTVSMVVLLYCFSIVSTNQMVKEAHKKEVEFLTEKQRHSQEMIDQSTLALVEAIDAKDRYTNGHSRRVAVYSRMIAERIGKTPEECYEIYLIALLHDVGKIGIPDAIINKTSKLTDDEFAIIKTHPTVGGDILSKIKSSPNLSIGARWHHERYDGKGYPDGLKGEEIPETARIIAVADSYDAMSSKRSYRDALPQYKIKSEFQDGIGTQFDPRFAKVMIDIINEDVEYMLREH